MKRSSISVIIFAHILLISALPIIARCACESKEKSFFNTPKPSVRSRSNQNNHMQKANTVRFHIIWHIIDPKTDITWILVKYMQPTGRGAYMTAPYYTFTATQKKPPRTFTAAWTIKPRSNKQTIAKVFSIKKTGFDTPSQKENPHTYKWVKLEDIRQNTDVKQGTYTGINVITRDNVRIWIDEKLVRALIEKNYAPLVT